MKVSDLGEFGLIDRLREALASQAPTDALDRLAVGIGDDAAVWRVGDRAVVATTDTLVEGVHFLPERTPWRDLGWKALAVNASDIAAMGGTPDFALVTLALPESALVERIDELYQGLAQAGEAFGVTVAGGDVVRSPTTAISVTLSGQAQVDPSGEPVVLRRNAAEPGDLLAVTGALGGAAGGLRALRDGKPGPAVEPLVDRHLRPQARIAEGRAALAAGIRCAIDISDGLLQDLGHICSASRMGAVVWRDKLPIEPALIQGFGPEEALVCAATGGEDYELLFAAGKEQITTLAREAARPITVIGEIVIDAGHEAKLLDEAGREVALASAGWDHLKREG